MHPPVEYVYIGRRQRTGLDGVARLTGGNRYRCPVCRRVRPKGQYHRTCDGTGLDPRKRRSASATVEESFIDVGLFLTEALRQIDLEEIRCRKFRFNYPGEEPITPIPPVLHIKTSVRKFIWDASRDDQSPHHEKALKFVRAVNRKAIILRKQNESAQLA